MFKLPTSGRLTHWKNFRSQLNLLSFEKALIATEQFWQLCPFTPFYLDVEKPDTWPNPWELLTENYYCDLAKVLGIVYTLHLTDHKNNLDPEIHVYYNSQTKHDYHIAYFCHGKYVLNLVEGEIVNKEHINQQLKLKHRYTAMDLKLEQY